MTNETSQTATTEHVSPVLSAAGPAFEMKFCIVGAVVCALVIGSAVWFKWFHDSSTSDAVAAGAPRIVVVDTAKIIVAATNKALASPKTAEETGKLGARLVEAIQQYRAAGVLVLNGYSVISVPPDMDKTAEVAAKVGVKLE